MSKFILVIFLSILQGGMIGFVIGLQSRSNETWVLCLFALSILIAIKLETVINKIINKYEHR